MLAGSNSAAFTVSASSQFNFSGTITLSCAGNTSVNCSFVPASITAGKNSILTVSGLGGLAGGTAVSFNVVGTSGPQSASEALSISIADFSLAASSASATVTAGQTATYTLTIQPSGGFNQQIALSCSGAPLAATCAVSSIAVTPDGTDPVSVTVTVTTTAPSTAGTPGMFNRRWPQAPGRLPWLWWIAALLLIAAPVWLRRRRPRYLLLACAAAILAWAACGGGSSQLPILKGTPSGTYTLTVTGVSGSLSHSINLTLNVS